MNILVLAHSLPPALNPQAIQIGRVLYHLPPNYRRYVATTSYKTTLACDAYTEWDQRAQETVAVSSFYGNPLMGIWMRLFPFLYRIPEPSRWDMRDLKRAIMKRWSALKFDRLITFAMPFSNHLLGLELKKHFRCPWIAHFSDPWAPNPLMNYGPVSRPLNNSWERQVMTSADHLIFVSEETRTFYAHLYPDQASRMRVIEHSFDPALYPSARKVNPSGPLKMRFLGNLYGGRNFDTLFKALAQLVHENAISPDTFQVELCLSYRRPLETQIRSYGLGTFVTTRAPVSYRESLALMHAADLLLTIDTPLPSSFKENVFFPSKLADYIGTGNPIIAIAGAGATQRVVENYGGWVVPDDGETLAKQLRKLVTDRSLLATFKPSETTLQKYAIQTKIGEWMECLS